MIQVYDPAQSTPSTPSLPHLVPTTEAYSHLNAFSSAFWLPGVPSPRTSQYSDFLNLMSSERLASHVSAISLSFALCRAHIIIKNQLVCLVVYHLFLPTWVEAAGGQCGFVLCCNLCT